MKRKSVQPDEGSLYRVLREDVVFENSPNDKSPPPAIQLRWSSIASSLVSAVVALLILGGHTNQQKAEAVNVNAGSGNEVTKALIGQEEHQTYQLAAGAHVDVSEISGPVSVEAIDGSSAEVHIYRTATNSDDLAYRKVFVEQTSSGLTIRQKTGTGEPSKVDLLNRVVLKLPRQVSVRGKNVSGDFIISGVAGPVDLNSISGSVDAKQVKGTLTVSRVSGDVRLAIACVEGAELRVNSVSRNVYLRLASDLNAELSISNTTGGVSNKIEGLALDRVGAASYSARFGSGGPRIVVSNVTGMVVLQRI